LTVVGGNVKTDPELAVEEPKEIEKKPTAMINENI